MEIKPEIIEIVLPNSSRIWQEIIDNDKVLYEIITSTTKCLEKILGDISEIKIRDDLLRYLDIYKNHSNMMLAIGGNKNPAFCRIINLCFSDNKNNKKSIANIFISWQEQEPPKKEKNNLFNKIKNIFK